MAELVGRTVQVLWVLDGKRRWLDGNIMSYVAASGKYNVFYAVDNETVLTSLNELKAAGRLRFQEASAAGSKKPKSTMAGGGSGGGARTKEPKLTSKAECVVCSALGRAQGLDDKQLLRYEVHSAKSKFGRKVVTIHACCALRAPPPPGVPPQQWWSVQECSSAWPTCAPTRVCSTDASFEPYPVHPSDWLDEFAFYNFYTLQASSRRFAGLEPPYSCLRPSAALWRSDDRGSIGFCRAAPPLADAAASEGISRAAILLWGALVYRVVNRLSTFSRWAAVRHLMAQRGPGWKWKAGYEVALYGDDRDEEAARIASSGVTLLGRLGVRDKWAQDEAEAVRDGTVEPAACTVRLPLPSEADDFVAFVGIERAAKRGVMTSEHQVQGVDRVCSMLKALARNGGKRLTELSAAVSAARDAQTALDALQTLDTVGPFFAWQAFSDLVGVSPVEPDALPAAVIRDSLRNYALFGPGARKGALMLDGGEDSYGVLWHDTDTNQAAALVRAQTVVRDFPLALRRLGLQDAWQAVAGGREYDLETAEHLLCGWYGVVPARIRSAVCALDLSGLDPRKAGGAHSVSTSTHAGEWRPNRCTDLEREEWLKQLATGKGTRE